MARGARPRRRDIFPIGWTGGGVAVPVNTALPVITGTPVVGQTLSCTTGTWTNSPTAYYYLWYRDATYIAESLDSTTWTLVAADVGKMMSCEVMAENAGGTSNTAMSNALGLVTAPAVGGAALLVGETDGFATDFTTRRTRAAWR